MDGRNLQSFYHITMEKVGDITHVTFHSRIHTNREVKCPFGWSAEYEPIEILNDRDFINWVSRKYGEVCV